MAIGATGLTELTPQRMQLDAGVFLENFDYSTATNAATFKALLDTAIDNRTGLLGATRGGGTFVATPTTREPEIDGKRHRTKGLIRFDTWDIRLTGTMVEAYPDNFKRVLATADKTTSGNVDTVTLRTAVANTDYIDKLCWITLLGDGTYMLIELDNVINLDGATFTFQDKNEGTLPFNFGATMANLSGTANAPFRIKYFHPGTGEMSSITLASAAGSSTGQTSLTVSGYSKPAGGQYLYKVGTASDAAELQYGDVPNYSWTQWNGSSAITLDEDDNGKWITVVCMEDMMVVAQGKTTLTVKLST